jgi:hypothetical protein
VVEFLEVLLVASCPVVPSVENLAFRVNQPVVVEVTCRQNQVVVEVEGRVVVHPLHFLN